MRPLYFALATAAFGTAGLLSAAIADGMTTAARSAATLADESPDQLHYVEGSGSSTTVSAAAPRSLDGAAFGAALADGATSRDPRQPVAALEYRPTEHWSTQLQYSYMSVGGSGGDAAPTCCSADDNWKIDRQILAVQFGVSYHFK